MELTQVEVAPSQLKNKYFWGSFVNQGDLSPTQVAVNITKKDD